MRINRFDVIKLIFIFFHIKVIEKLILLNFLLDDYESYVFIVLRIQCCLRRYSSHVISPMKA